MTPEAKAILKQSIHLQKVKKGTIFFKEDDPSTHLYFIIKGSVCITKAIKTSNIASRIESIKSRIKKAKKMNLLDIQNLQIF